MDPSRLKPDATESRKTKNKKQTTGVGIKKNNNTQLFVEGRIMNFLGLLTGIVPPLVAGAAGVRLVATGAGAGVATGAGAGAGSGDTLS